MIRAAFADVQYHGSNRHYLEQVTDTRDEEIMKATEVLMDEHRVIERVLGALEEAASRLERGVEVDASFFLEATDFIRGFADGCHHQKEEGVLFKAMTAAGMPQDQGPPSRGVRTLATCGRQRRSCSRETRVQPR
jgi:hypothetical protein